MPRKAKPASKAVGRPFAKGDDPRRNVTVPGPGRPPSEVRAACREAFVDRIPLLSSFADDTDNAVEQRISAIDKLGKYGLSGAVSADDVRERLKATLQEVRSALPADQAEMLISRIKPHWMAA